jgi:hypothetical protein
MMMNPKLKHIISVYANLWADVLYNKKLGIHLQKIDHDIAFIGLLITLRYFRRNESMMLAKIHKELILMREIIKKRISSGDHI